MNGKQKTIISEVEVVMVNRPITDNTGETLETINLTSYSQDLAKEQFEKAVKEAAYPLPQNIEGKK